MKKTMIGLAAIGCLMFAGQQTSATTLSDALSAYSGPVWFDLEGYGKSGNGTGETWTVFTVKTVSKVETVSAPSDVLYSWTSAGADRIYGVTYGLYDVSTTGSTGNITIGQGQGSAVVPGFTLWEGTGNINFLTLGPGGRIGTDGYGDGVSSTGTMTKILTADFDRGVDVNPLILVSQKLIDATSPTTGEGKGYASVTGGLISNALDSGYFVDANFGDTHDVFLSFNVLLPGAGATAGWSQLLRDPAMMQAVPEPSTMLLIGLGLVSLAGIGRRKLQK
jgi:hypothetical protein